MLTWRINLRTQQLSQEAVPQKWERLGGRGLSALILVDEGVANSNPLGPANKLIFAPGLLVGHRLSSCDRISVGGKSPLTGGIKESNAGGRTGFHLAALGIKALILEDAPTHPGWWVLRLDKKGVVFEPADDLVGMGVYAAASKLLERYGDKVSISLIGPGGEKEQHSAGIQNLDKDGVPSRINARGGLGAVMGSKKIKAIVIDSPGRVKPPVLDPQAFKEAQKVYNAALLAHPQTAVYAEFGTAAMTRMCDTFGGLPTRNFTQGSFEQAELISGETLRETILQRGGAGDPSHACMQGCAIRCSNVYAGADGQAIVSPLEYETIGLLGSNLGISDLDVIARLNWEVNDLGLDSIEMGAALGVAASAGIFTFGDGAAALALVKQARQGTPLGQALGNGAAATAALLGVKRVPVVKGQAISAYDPRAIKGTGVTYATSPQGADHTAGLTIRAKVNHLKPEGQANISRTAQINMAGYDTLGVCIFAGFGFAQAKDAIRNLILSRYGWDGGDNILQALGRETLRLEREFNFQAGFRKEDDRLPEWLSQEPLPPHQAVFDVPPEDLDSVFKEF